MKTWQALSICVLFPCWFSCVGWHVEASAKETENSEPLFVSLIPVQETSVEFLVPEQEIYTNGGRTWVVTEGRRVEVTTENVGAFFVPIDSAAKAMELCQLLQWGTLVEHKEDFEKILALYRDLGFTPELGKESVFISDVALYDSPMTFGSSVQETPGGFDVAFTAFVLGRGMGARVSISRYHYTVSQEGAVIQKDVNVYLRGPVISWQTAELFGQQAGQQAAEEQKLGQVRRNLIEGVYAICSRLIPVNIHARARRSTE